MTQKSSFNGTAIKIQIISNSISYGPCPLPEDEIEQRLTISRNGRVFFSSYAYGNGVKYTKIRSKNFKIDVQKAMHILNVIGDCFSEEYNVPLATDVGDWEMTITNENNTKYKFCGSLCSGCSDKLDTISDIIRFNLNMPELLVFDGRENSDRIEKISIDYHHVTKIKPGVIPEGATWEYAIWDYSEHLTIDRKTETLEHIQNIGSGCQVSRKYRVEDGISSLLDDIDAESFFSHTEGNPSDVIHNSLETQDYRITIGYLYGDEKVLTGTFDKNGLPDDFADFAETVYDFMCFYGMGEILDPAVHNKLLRRQYDYIFCNVQFDEDGKTYCYLTDDDTLETDDYVVVPVGKDNHESIAKIESIEYHSAEDVPFPLDSVKKIIRKSDKVGIDDDSIVVPKGAVIMGSEPLTGVTADEWRAMFDENCNDEDLAKALAGAWNECGWLGHDLDDDDCTPETKAAYEEWYTLEQELIRKVALRLNRECKTPYVKLIAPFMERNGYRDGCGWWVKTEE